MVAEVLARYGHRHVVILHQLLAIAGTAQVCRLVQLFSAIWRDEFACDLFAREEIGDLTDLVVDVLDLTRSRPGRSFMPDTRVTIWTI